VASGPGDGVSPNELIAAADSALYKAKRSGRNRSVCSSGGSASAETVQVKVFDGPESSSLSTIYALAATVDSRDRYSKNHSKQVHDCAVAIGEELGMNQLEINHLGTCALLHDIGKIGISDELLNKKDSLSDEEWETIRSHSRLGAAIVGHSSQLLPCVQGILHHHEKFDGTGYPDRLKGQLIPLESRILAIADSFAAMTSRRPYSRPLKQDEAVEEIKKGAGTQFDPELVEVFIRIIPRVFELIEQSR
jgi:HD-GYP domain-containing protein (c-di-GMP phosphodiesterase class II)